MASLSLEVLDQHIDNLREQLRFLNEVLKATDHNAPDWLATDLVSLRNKSGRLQDDMKRFRDEVETHGVAEKHIKTSNKRLSLESAKSTSSTSKSKATNSQAQDVSQPINQPSASTEECVHIKETYVVESIDVSAEVNRRLQEARYRRLVQTPRTAHKRKYDAYEEARSESNAEADNDDSGWGNNANQFERTPTKRLKSSGMFGQIGKRKDNEYSWETQNQLFDDSTAFKKRKL